MPPRLLSGPSYTLRQRLLSACISLPPSWTPSLVNSNIAGNLKVSTRHKQTDASSSQQNDAGHFFDPDGGNVLYPDEFHRTASRHVLRGILRECTYLPDPFVATWIRQHAMDRFRTYDYRIFKNRDDPEFKKRLETVRRKSRQALYQLRRANEGDRKMMLKALSMGYGRIGKRRRDLMKPLFPVELQQNEEEAGQLQMESPVPRNHVSNNAKKKGQSAKDDALGPVKAQIKEAMDDLPRPLHALLKSQIEASPPSIARRNPRRLGLELPELNAWHKPMPQSRVKNKLKEWYANLLSTVQAPLPEKEWYDLRDLALRKKTGKLPITRRKQLTPPPSVLEMVVKRGKLPADMFRKGHAHHVTPRFMQRVWLDVFSQCPLMKYDPSTQRWSITWGHHAMSDSRFETAADAGSVTDEAANTKTG